ncbi:hypothetical protein L1049_026454 [Liquidambar formosana]|uniref:Uncharacterized protein n=1 Tax=Liquidambar formosana TaxID=63359 RepID=A0AAP0R7W1_LIQFO
MDLIVDEALDFSLLLFWLAAIVREKDDTKDKRVSLVVQSSRKQTFPSWCRVRLWDHSSSILPFWKKKSEGLVKLQENVASIAEQASDMVAEKLPKDGTLKDAVLLVKPVSKEAIKDSHLT